MIYNHRFIMRRFSQVVLLLVLGVQLLLTGCGNKATSVPHLHYPESEQLQTVFVEQNVPGQCRVFAHQIVTTPADTTFGTIRDHIETMAMQSGADILYIGLARENFNDIPDTFQYTNYGPTSAYDFHRQWSGWRYGFSKWTSGGEMVGIGFKNWTSTDISQETSLFIQAALLRCQ